jgi:hypothetical protein
MGFDADTLVKFNRFEITKTVTLDLANDLRENYEGYEALASSKSRAADFDFESEHARFLMHIGTF